MEQFICPEPDSLWIIVTLWIFCWENEVTYSHLLSNFMRLGNKVSGKWV